MADFKNNTELTWQLVSQFVSWEFCRYICEQQKEPSSSDTDVLTYLRDMVVQRTAKPVSEITKHEIVAKFIMDIKEVQNFSRIPDVLPLLDTVRFICPELEPAVSKLVYHLTTFLEVLENTDDDRKELLQMRIGDAIEDFLKEANRLLPEPHLLQVVESWSTHRSQSHPRYKKKVIHSAMLFEKVLECIHDERITSSEAKVIAVSLKEDKLFQKIMINAQTEPESEADSEQFSHSIQSSQPNENIYSQEFAKNSQACKDDRIQTHLLPPSQNPDSLNLDSCPPVPGTDYNVPEDLELEPNVEPPPVLTAVSPSSPGSPIAYPFLHRINPLEIVNEDTPEHRQGVPAGNGYEGFLRNDENRNNMVFAQSSANESQSDDFNSVLHNKVCLKFKEIYNNQRIHNESDSDTSDCEKNPEFRFLTPTLFKPSNKKTAPKTQTRWLSDSESNDSSIITCAGNSQKNDPNWSSIASVQNQLMKNRWKKNLQFQKTAMRRPSDVSSFVEDEGNQQNDSDWASRAPVLTQRSNVKASKNRVSKKKKVQQIYSDSGSSVDDVSVRSSVPSLNINSAGERPTKKRRLKLYTPNRSIQDFVSQIRRPVPVVLSEVPVHQGTSTRSTRKKPTQPAKSNSKRQQCKECSKSFKTVIALRRHVFLQHTKPPDNSDCDS